jgi:hypothetical protein
MARADVLDVVDVLLEARIAKTATRYDTFKALNGADSLVQSGGDLTSEWLEVIVNLWQIICPTCSLGSKRRSNGPRTDRSRYPPTCSSGCA